MKRILTIQDISCVGNCSLTAALPVLSAAGVECCGLPTALLSNHTGFPSFYSIDLTEQMMPVGKQFVREGIAFDGIYTGYIASAKQKEIITEIISMFRRDEAPVFVDPVMGDNGRMYSALSGDYPEMMRALCREADIITPNLTEACLLTRRAYDPLIPVDDLKNMLMELFSPSMKLAVITGASSGDMLGTVGFDGKRFFVCFTPKEDVSCSGTGDVFASALLGAVMNGADYPQSLEIATKFTYHAVKLTAEAPDKRFYGIHFQPALGEYIRLLSEIPAKARRDGDGT